MPLRRAIAGCFFARRTGRAATAGLLALAGGSLLVTPASAQTCGDLWYQRNAIYKNAGYCFSTARGINAFGNAGCLYDRQEDVPLSANQRREIADILRQERGSGCPR